MFDYSDIVNDSEFLKGDIKLNISDLPFDINLVVKFYRNKTINDFNEMDLVALIKQMDYLDNKYLIDIISMSIDKNIYLNENLMKIKEEIIIAKKMIENLFNMIYTSKYEMFPFSGTRKLVYYL